MAALQITTNKCSSSQRSTSILTRDLYEILLAHNIHQIFFSNVYKPISINHTAYLPILRDYLGVLRPSVSTFAMFLSKNDVAPLASSYWRLGTSGSRHLESKSKPSFCTWPRISVCGNLILHIVLKILPNTRDCFDCHRCRRDGSGQIVSVGVYVEYISSHRRSIQLPWG